MLLSTTEEDWLGMPRALHLGTALFLFAASAMANGLPALLQKWYDVSQLPLYLRGTLEVNDEIQHHQGIYDIETYWLPQDRVIRVRSRGTPQTALVVWERRRAGEACSTIKRWVSDPPSPWLRAYPSCRLESFAIALAVIPNLAENFFSDITNKKRCEWRGIDTTLPNSASLVVNDTQSNVVYDVRAEEDLTSSSWHMATYAHWGQADQGQLVSWTALGEFDSGGRLIPRRLLYGSPEDIPPRVMARLEYAEARVCEHTPALSLLLAEWTRGLTLSTGRGQASSLRLAWQRIRNYWTVTNPYGVLVLTVLVFTAIAAIRHLRARRS